MIQYFRDAPVPEKVFMLIIGAYLIAGALALKEMIQWIIG